MPYYFPIATEKTDGLMPFLRVLAQSETGLVVLECGTFMELPWN